MSHPREYRVSVHADSQRPGIEFHVSLTFDSNEERDKALNETLEYVDIQDDIVESIVTHLCREHRHDVENDKIKEFGK